MDVYLAAPYAARDQIKAYAQELTRIGFTVMSSWLDETHEITDGTIDAATDLDDHAVAKHASDDFADIRCSDLFVLFTATAVGHLPANKTTSGGRHVETGYFIATNGTRHVVVIGEPENVFHRAAGITVVPDWHEAVLELSARLVATRSTTTHASLTEVPPG